MSFFGQETISSRLVSEKSNSLYTIVILRHSLVLPGCFVPFAEIHISKRLTKGYRRSVRYRAERSYESRVCIVDIPLEAKALANEDPDHPCKEGGAKPGGRLCLRCCRSMEFQFVIATIDDRPAYRIFGCERCGAIDWTTC
jgi:hypothetical protein